MKIIVVKNNFRSSGLSEELAWYLLADSTLTNTGKPFYLPEDIGRVCVSIAPAIKINRLGKSIAQKFSPRYYSEYAPALSFRLPDMERLLIDRKLPSDAAFNFDRALFAGEFRAFEVADKMELRKKGEPVAFFDYSGLIKHTDELISSISRLNTLKTGDILVPALSGEVLVEEGDILEVFVNGSKAFHVKVK